MRCTVSPGDNKSVIDYTVGASLRGYTEGSDVPNAFTHHATDAANRITKHTFDEDGPGATEPVDTEFYYDAAGNLVFDGEKLFIYDAPALDSRLRQREQALLPEIWRSGYRSSSDGYARS